MKSSLVSLSTSLLLPLMSLAAFDGLATVDDIKFDLTELKGVHAVSFVDNTPPSISNNTWYINPVGVIPVDKAVNETQQCPENSQVCGIQHIYYPKDGEKEAIDIIREVIPVAGENIKGIKDSKLEPKFTRLKAIENSKQEGLKVELHGGLYQDRKQKAVIDFLCDREKTGNEEGKDGALQYVDYDEKKVLWLEWKTKYACEMQDVGSTPGEKKASWGFFTWFILIAFLVIAAYLIFGSWLNYNKYGARGWDLFPHSDTLRDLPYLVKDFARRVAGTFQGSGGRGGYSAV